MKGHPTVLYKSQTGRWRVQYSTGHARSVDRIASEYIDQLRAALDMSATDLETAASALYAGRHDDYHQNFLRAASRYRRTLEPPRQ